MMTLVCLLGMSQVVTAQTCTVIGEGTLTSSWSVPVATYYRNSYTQQLYLADELEMSAGIITSIAFQYDYSTATTRQISIFMANTDAENLSTSFVTEGLEEVFSATDVTFDNTGEDYWVTIELETPFAYDGSSNLVVAVYSNYSSTQTGYGGDYRFLQSSATGMARYWQNDTSSPDQFTITDGVATATTGTSSPSTASVRPNIQFCYTAGGSGVIPCDKPSGITASDIAARAAVLTWADGSGVYNVEYKKASDEEWTPLLSETTMLTTDLSNLDPNTDYQARVQSVCAGNVDNPVSGWKTVSFKTLIGLPFAEDFKSTSIPGGWSQKSGLVDDVMAGTSSLATGYSWSFNTANGVFDNHAKINIYGSSCKGWLLSPEILMEDNVQLTFDMALTAYNGDLVKVDQTQQADDRFVVLASTDSCATWTILREWNNSGSEYVYNNIACSATGEEAVINLSQFAGQNVVIAFYGESTVSGGDNEFHLDNILIDYIPRCLKPSDLKVENITTSQAELSWTANSSESEWILQYKKSSENAWQSINVTANPYTLDNLDAYTNYDFRVAASCDQIDEFGTSKFSSVVSFKTNAAAPFVEAFTSLPSDWKRYAVLYSDITAGEDTLTNHPVTSGWTVSTGNGVYGVNHLKLNVYGENVKNWIVSPLIEMNQAEMQLTFDLALTKSSGTLEAPEAGQQDDDKFSVLITADGGETWEELYVRDNVTAADSYDNISCTADGQTVKIDLSAYAESTIAIAFYGESTVAGGDNYLHIRNFDIDTIPACEKPMGLQVIDIRDDAATFAWDEFEGAEWEYALVVDTFTVTTYVPTDEDFTGTTDAYTVTIDTLTENTPYIFFLRQTCGGSSSEYIARGFQTIQTPATVPFADDFEDGNNWLLVNGEITNAWVLGEATNNGGTHALYISDDNGVSNKYSHSAAMVYAVKSFEIAEEATYTFKYDWKAAGEGNYDYIRVALVPTSVQLEASTTILSGLSYSALPQGWVALDGGEKLNLSADWQTKSVDLEVAPGLYNVVIAWRNDGSGGTQTPAGAIDNFSIKQLLCARPENVILAEGVDSLSTTSAILNWEAQGNESNWLLQYKKSADIEWTALAEPITAKPYTLEGLEASTAYDVQIAAWCNPADSATISEWSETFSFATACDVITNFPYSENFDGMEGVTSGNALPVCWDYINTVTGSTSYDYYPTVYKGSSYANSGTNSLKMYSYYNYEGEMYAILPEMEGLSALRMKFNARKYSASSYSYYYDATFVVGILNSAADTANFVAIDTISPASTSYEPFEVRFNTYEGTGKFIAFKMVSPDYIDYDYNGAFIDDIVIDYIPDCFEPAAVKVLTKTATSVQFTYTALAQGDSLSYAIVAKGVEPTEFIGIAADTVLVEGLEASTEYELYIRTECANSASASISTTFLTKQLPIDLGDGFADDFEGANQWNFENGEIENAWVHGTAAHNGEGSTKAMYISNNGGAAHAYSVSSYATVYAMKAFNIAAGSYTFQYDWMANGESTFDYIRAALVPASVELTASTSLPTGVSATALPEGCIAIDGGSKQNLSTAWATYTSAELTIPAGTYNVVFLWRNDGSGGSQTPAAIDNFSITKILCGKPASVTIEKANITSTSAEIAWTAEEGQTAWQIALDTIAAFIPDSVALISVNANPYLAENLLPEHTYYVYVRANCGENGFSAWSARASFKTAKACQKPDGLDVTAITDSSAVVTWNTYGQNDFILTYGIGNAFADTVRNITSGTYTITGLDENTSYKVKVAAACDDTQWTSAKTFKTACSPMAAVVENFDGITGSTSSHVLPDCWDYINSGSSYAAYPLVYSSESYANSGTNSLRFYTYGSSSYADQYAVLPAVNNLNTLRIKLNACKYSTSYSATIVVGIMTVPADTATFVAIDTIRPAGIAYEPFIVSFGEYTGEGKYVALKAPVPASSYNAAHIDDIVMEAIPSCLEPTGLAVSDIATTSATLDWTSTASQWQILLNNDSLIDVAAKPFVLNELTPATTYTFAVRAICAEGDTSAWSKSAKFATECAIIATYPWSENFNKLGAGIPLCWDNSAGTTTSDSYKWNYFANATDTCLRFNSYSNSSDKTNILATPEFALTEPVLFSFKWKNPTGGAGLVMISNDGGLTMDTLASELTEIADWTSFEINLSAYTGDTVVIYFHGTSNYGNGDAYLYIDDVVMEILPACPKTTGLAATIVGDVTASFAWDAEEDVTWEYGFVVDTVANFVPADEDFTGVATTNEATLNALTPETSYLFFIRKVCGEEKSEIIYKSFSTIMLATALPYDDDFENGNSWKLINGTCTNAWTVGSAATESGNALYISNDGGTTFEYTNTSAAMVYAAKAFNFDKAGSYTVSYDWRANGESTYDYLRVAIVPATVELAAATSVPSGFGPTGLPTGWKAADGGSKLNLSDAWQSKSVVVENIVPGYYLLVFAWRDDTSTGAQSPAAVDNLHIQHLDYPTAIGGTDAEGVQAIKFIENDHVYILINGVIYDATGRKVK